MEDIKNFNCQEGNHIRFKYYASMKMNSYVLVSIRIAITFEFENTILKLFESGNSH